MADVFISFVHEDEKVAHSVQRYLVDMLGPKAGVFISSDRWQIFAGENWLARIESVLSAARVVVLMLSRRSVKRPWVNFEAGRAWLTNKTMIPVCYGNLTKDTLPKPYSGIQSLNLPEEKHYLVVSVARNLQLPGPPPQPLAIEMQSLRDKGIEPKHSTIEGVLRDFEDEH
jgi:hypothetical protein